MVEINTVQMNVEQQKEYDRLVNIVNELKSLKLVINSGVDILRAINSGHSDEQHIKHCKDNISNLVKIIQLLSDGKKEEAEQNDYILSRAVRKLYGLNLNGMRSLIAPLDFLSEDVECTTSIIDEQRSLAKYALQCIFFDMQNVFSKDYKTAKEYLPAHNFKEPLED